MFSLSLFPSFLEGPNQEKRFLMYYNILPQADSSAIYLAKLFRQKCSEKSERNANFDESIS